MEFKPMKDGFSVIAYRGYDQVKKRAIVKRVGEIDANYDPRPGLLDRLKDTEIEEAQQFIRDGKESLKQEERRQSLVTLPAVIYRALTLIHADEQSAFQAAPWLTSEIVASLNKTSHLMAQAGAYRRADQSLASVLGVPGEQPIKRIFIESVRAPEDAAFIDNTGITSLKTKSSAKLIIDVNTAEGVRRKIVMAGRIGLDLFALSGQREEYRGYVVSRINAEAAQIEFANGVSLPVGMTQGERDYAVIERQIRHLIQSHLEHELLICTEAPSQRMKVLSLILVDSVHRCLEPGGIADQFGRAYKSLAANPRYAVLNLPETAPTATYFAAYEGHAKDTRGDTLADEVVYDRIKQDSARLGSASEPVRFLFSHVNLSEGWSHPQIFQVATIGFARLKRNPSHLTQIRCGILAPSFEDGEVCLREDINRLAVITDDDQGDVQREIEIALNSAT